MAYSHRANIQKDLIHFKETVRSLAVIANRSISSIRSPVKQRMGDKAAGEMFILPDFQHLSPCVTMSALLCIFPTPQKGTTILKHQWFLFPVKISSSPIQFAIHFHIPANGTFFLHQLYIYRSLRLYFPCLFICVTLYWQRSIVHVLFRVSITSLAPLDSSLRERWTRLSV